MLLNKIRPALRPGSTQRRRCRDGSGERLEGHHFARLLKRSFGMSPSGLLPDWLIPCLTAMETPPGGAATVAVPTDRESSSCADRRHAWKGSLWFVIPVRLAVPPANAAPKVAQGT